MSTLSARSSLAHARLVQRISSPRLGKDAERRAAFLALARTRRTFTVSDALHVTTLGPGSRGTVLRLLSELVEEGHLTRTTVPCPDGRLNHYALHP